MENPSSTNSLKSIALKLQLGDVQETAYLLVDPSGALAGVLNIAALRSWMENRGEFLTAGKTAPVVDDIVRRDIRLFGSTPCWFEGCEELRAAYKEELARISANAKCKPCEKGAVTRKYLQLAAAKQANGRP